MHTADAARAKRQMKTRIEKDAESINSKRQCLIKWLMTNVHEPASKETTTVGSDRARCSVVRPRVCSHRPSSPTNLIPGGCCGHCDDPREPTKTTRHPVPNYSVADQRPPTFVSHNHHKDSRLTRWGYRSNWSHRSTAKHHHHSGNHPTLLASSSQLVQRRPHLHSSSLKTRPIELIAVKLPAEPRTS